MIDSLVPANKYNKNINTLSVLKRIAIDYPILIRDEVARKLAAVAEKLPGDLKLQVDSGYRAPSVQKILWETRFKQFKKENPTLKDEEVVKITETLVANPNNKKSSHTTGGAVDISLIREDKEINLSAPFTKYYEEPQLKSSKITKEAQEMRFLLNKLMTDQGFVANPKEYWHFSYGDKRWADYTKSPQIYFQMELDPKYLYPVSKRLFNKILRKFWQLGNNIFKFQTNY